MNSLPSDVAAADARVVDLAKGVKLLSALSWPAHLKQEFLDAWRRGAPKIPTAPSVAVPPSLRDAMPELAALAEPRAEHPLAHFVADTAKSYLDAGRLLQAAGTGEFTTISVEIYGRPQDIVAPGAKMRSIDAARRLVRASSELAASVPDREDSYCLLPSMVQAHLQSEFDSFFGTGVVGVELDPSLAAKAAAGANAVRIRGETCYSDHDLVQLVQHEGLVHTATLRNGRGQEHLRCLGLGAPRTTAAQEGLATFAELITNSVDLTRLSRIALRIVAIDKALDGADFLDLFAFFLEAGQTPDESFQSTARIFRGGDPRGGAVFTKDAVYLRGLIDTYAFLHAALAARKVRYPTWMFAGRMTWPDLVALEPWFDDGTLSSPEHVPSWAAHLDRLAAYLAFSNLTHRLQDSALEFGAYVSAAERDG